MVDCEMVHTESPVTLSIVCLALGFATLIGADFAVIAANNKKVTNKFKANSLMPWHGQLAVGTAPRGVPHSHLSSRLQDDAHNLPPEVEER